MNLVSDAFIKEFQPGKTDLTTSVGICRVFDSDTIGQPPKPHLTSALWDTGSSNCMITRALAESLELHPIKKVPVAHHEGLSYSNVYLMAIYVTKRYYFFVELTETNAPSDNFEIIIGMDVISKGDFALTSKNNRITFSFRLPSSTHIDFTKEV
ncbi:MAG: hypothetical protein HYZ14_18635 [Bacteroidetes bacterium]|nr:hypothetical protein [Bacteroidota bacterium]